MNDFCTDIGYCSLNKYGEQLCGDHVEIIKQDDSSCTIVLADGLGSGVKACILSTLTSKIISTMIAASVSIEECISTMAATLPVCSERKLAYSTFAILRIVNGNEAEIIQYDNPRIMLFRSGKEWSYPVDSVIMGGKKIFKSFFPICEGDIFIAVSDGAVHAGPGNILNLNWGIDNIIEYLQPLCQADLTAKVISTVLLDKCNELYEGTPSDDVTVCTVKIRKRQQVNLVIGPPSNPDDCTRMMSLFFSKAGKHIVCGGTTSSIAAEFLNEPMRFQLEHYDPEVPPIAELDGADLVTEGIITINKVLVYAKDYIGKNESFNYWSSNKDGASRIARLLLEEGTDINFFVGKAINPAHQNLSLPINFSIKMRVVEELADCLEKMGKRIKVVYF